MQGLNLNLSTRDRGIRVILGLLIIAAGVIFHNWYGALGLVLLVTATVGWCPLYVPFGISSLQRQKRT